MSALSCGSVDLRQSPPLRELCSNLVRHLKNLGYPYADSTTCERMIRAYFPYTPTLTEGSADFQGQYDAQLDKVKTDITRGILEGNMLAFVSPASAKMAELVETAFKDVEPNSMKGVKVLFIGQSADSARVEAAVKPAGVNYVFVEAK